MEAASSISQTAVTAVRDVLVTTVSGVKEVFCAILPKGEGTPESGAEAPEKKAPKGKSEGH
jgi:hypothetical protein